MNEWGITKITHLKEILRHVKTVGFGVYYEINVVICEIKVSLCNLLYYSLCL